MCFQSCLHMDVILLVIDGCLLPLVVGGRSVKFENLLIQPGGQSVCECLDGLWYVKSVLS